MPKILTEKIVNTEEYAGCVDLITGLDDFECNVTYDPLFHIYRYKGEIIPSVTQLLDDGGYNDVPKEVLEVAQFKGTLVHKEIENYWNKKEIGFTKEFCEFLRLFKENNVMFDDLCVWDYKTYNYNNKDKRHKCYKQLSKYAEAIKYLTGIEIKNKRMIWLPHKGKGKIFNLEEEFGNDNK